MCTNDCCIFDKMYFSFRHRQRLKYILPFWLNRPPMELIIDCFPRAKSVVQTPPGGSGLHLLDDGVHEASLPESSRLPTSIFFSYMTLGGQLCSF